MQNVFADAGIGSDFIQRNGSGSTTSVTSTGIAASSNIAHSGKTKGRLFRSAGTELVAEIEPFCYQLPIHIGYRCSYLFDISCGWNTPKRFSHDIFLCSLKYGTMI